MVKMDPKLKADWLKALRSGKFEQGEGYLQRGGKHCCLGVLCDVMGICVASPRFSNVISYEFPHKKGFYETSLPRGVVKGLGLKTQEELVSLNDDQHASFDEIADWIERKM